MPKMKIRNLQSEIPRVTCSCPLAEKRTIIYPEGACDINKIVERYKRTGAWPGNFHMEGKYVDHSDDLSFHDLQNVKRAYAASLSDEESQAFLSSPREFLAAKMAEFSSSQTASDEGAANAPSERAVTAPAGAESSVSP